MALDETQRRPRSGGADETISVVVTPPGAPGAAGASDASKPDSSGESARFPALKPGDRLGGCVVERFLAAGGMGEVYEGRHETLDRRVAIKLIREKYAGDPKYRERFLREAKVAAQFTEPHIAIVFDAGEEGRLLYVVFEFIEGEDVARKLHRLGPMPPQEALRIARDAASGLTAAHAKGIIHRDIKPSNIMLTTTGAAKLTDFGLVRIMHTEDGDSDSIIGTPQYMSPEQWQNRGLDGRADLYSLGITLYEMLCGHLPVSGSSLGELCNQALAHQLAPLRERHPGLDPQVYALVDGLIAPLAERIPSAQETVKRIERILGTLPAGARASLAEAYPTSVMRAGTAPPAAVHALKPRKSRAPVAGVLLMVALAGLILSIWPGSGESEALKERILPPVQLEWLALTPRQAANGQREHADLVSGTLKAGDEFQLRLWPQQDCYLYVIWLNAQGKAVVLEPPGGDFRNARVCGHKEIVLPNERESFRVGDQPGTQAVYLVASYEPVRGLSQLLRHAAAAPDGVPAKDWQKILDAAGETAPPKGYAIDAAQSLPGTTLGQLAVRFADGRQEEHPVEIITGKAALVRKLTLRKL